VRVTLRGRGDFTEWRDAARDLLRRGVDPRDVDWVTENETDLFANSSYSSLPFRAGKETICAANGGGAGSSSVPRDFLTLATDIVQHSDPTRFALAYRLLWRLQTEKHLLDIAPDPDFARARQLSKSVHRDAHKMTAFVRFKEVPAQGPRRAFVAWFEPDHWIVARTAPFFQRRFGDMDWVIATPKGAAAWDGEHLRCDDEAADRPDISDDADELWRTYYANIFNPARLKIKSMQGHMPKKYWKNLPEAGLIPDLIAGAEGRVREMAERAASTSKPKFHNRLRGR